MKEETAGRDLSTEKVNGNSKKRGRCGKKSTGGKSALKATQVAKTNSKGVLSLDRDVALGGKVLS